MSTTRSSSATSPGLVALLDLSKISEPDVISKLSSFAGKVAEISTLSCYKDSIELDDLPGMNLLVLPPSGNLLTAEQCERIHGHVREGGSLMLLLSEIIPDEELSNINFLIEEFGISANSDSVIRTSFLIDYPHPKQALVEGGILPDSLKPNADRFVYPYGCTLNVQSPAIPILSTGSLCYPFNRPIGAVSGIGSGRVCVIGSWRLLTDPYTDVSMPLLDRILSWLLFKDNLEIVIPSPSPITDYKYISNVHALAARPLSRICSELDPLPSDITSLADLTLFEGGSGLVDEVMDAYAHLGIPHGPLSTSIKPAFVVPLPKRIPAIPPPSFYPILRSPPLPLVDLDDLTSPPGLRLNRLAKTCASRTDVDRFVLEAGHITGLDTGDPAYILKQLLNRLIR